MGLYSSNRSTMCTFTRFLLSLISDPVQTMFVEVDIISLIEPEGECLSNSSGTRSLSVSSFYINLCSVTVALILTLLPNK